MNNINNYVQREIKAILFFTFLMLLGSEGFAQSKFPIDDTEGKLYIYWGWNRGYYTNSDISFKGDDYDFTLKSVKAKDRQTKFALDPYFHPLKITIPQTNFRIGYYFKPNWDISIGVDHMKYVVEKGQKVKISGTISDTESGYAGVYSNDDITLSENFLELEHTDGLNYINAEIRHSNTLFAREKLRLTFIQGVGIGGMMPKTNITLLSNDRYDEFNWTGVGMSGLLALNIRLFNRFFIQSEVKGGYVAMPSIRTSNSGEKASQSFFFGQYNILLGGLIRIKSRNKKN